MKEALKINDIIAAIEAFAPLAWQEEWDNSGIQVGDVQQPLKGIVLCVDVTEEVLDTAIAKGYNLILSHHPLLFKPLSSIQGRNYVERCVIKACKHDIVIYAAHTNFDSAPQGVSFRLAQKLGLTGIEPLNPQPGILSPTGEAVGIGVVGNLPEAMPPEQFLKKIQSTFSLQRLPYAEGIHKPVKKVAICSGSGGSVKKAAIAAQADVLLTGEAKYNDYLDAAGNLLLVTIGHFESEACTIDIFCDIIRKNFTTFAPDIVRIYTNPVKYLE